MPIGFLGLHLNSSLDFKTQIMVFKHFLHSFKHLTLFSILLVFSLLVQSCVKNDGVGEAWLQIRLTDAPALYDAVNIEILAVEITGTGSGTTTINTNSGIYNLLDFTGGIDTLIASSGLAAGKLQQVRLILGTNNSVVLNGVSYPLSTPSAMQSGLKLQVHKQLVAGVSYALLLDFDAAQSVVELGNGQFALKPVIRVVDEAINGSISAVVVPNGSQSMATALGLGLAFSSYTDSTGFFIISGVPAGSYDLVINPQPPLQPDTISGVVVVNGQLTDLGQIVL